MDYGFEIYLVNAYHVKNIPGRKSDVSDARWLQELHSFGLLNKCFQPDNITRSLGNYASNKTAHQRNGMANKQNAQIFRTDERKT